MISLYDLTPFEFLLLVVHCISFLIYCTLGMTIIRRRKYLKWHFAIYPSMIFASFGIAIVFLQRIINGQSNGIFFHLCMWLLAYNQFSQLFDIIKKHHRIEVLEESEKKYNMNKIMVLLIFLAVLTGCNARKVELENVRKEYAEKSSSYEKQIKELNVVILEKENKEKNSSEKSSQLQSEISSLKKERSELQEKLKKETKDDIIITNPTGTVKVTDSQGNAYEIPGGQGTQISKTSTSILTQALTNIKESYQESIAKVKNLEFSLKIRDKVISEKESKIDYLESVVVDRNKTIDQKESEKKKNTERKAYPVWWWLVAGFFLGIIAIELIRKNNPFNILKTLKL